VVPLGLLKLTAAFALMSESASVPARTRGPRGEANEEDVISLFVVGGDGGYNGACGGVKRQHAGVCHTPREWHRLDP
jgi:hypothetical protein